MFLGIFEAFLLAVALCADCFAVSACSSVSLSGRRWRDIFPVALSFAIIQAALFAAGALLGELVSGYVMGIAHAIGFLLLLYVGGSMLFNAFKGEDKREVKNLSGLKNIIIGGVATSIDALSVGASLSIDGISMGEAATDTVAIFLVTAASVVLGILGGSKVGEKFGRPALIAGGVILILIGLNIVFGIV